MAIARWAAAAVTLLMGLANAGLVTQDNLALKVLGPVLALAALAAVVGIVTAKQWGVGAVIAVGALNLLASVVAAISGQSGWPISLVLSVLAIVLSTASQSRATGSVAA